MIALNRERWKECKKCGTWVLIPKATTEAYPGDYFGGPAAKFSGWAQRLRASFHGERARLVQQRLNRTNGKIYDVGCGDGLFLEEASRLGLKVAGFEPESVPRNQAETRLSTKLDRKLFASLALKKASAITCWQVIEHLDDPPAFLKTCRRHLIEGGLLAVSTVNLDSLQAKLFRGNWLHLDPPRHLWVGGLRKVVLLVEEAGFRVERVRYNSLEFGPIGWIDSFVNLLDFKRDRLLICLKQGCKSPVDRLVYLLSAALTPLAFILSLVEGAINHPATFEVYARLEKVRARRQGG